MAELTYRSGDGVLGAVFGVFIRPQTYLNLVYLYLAFPLGIAYFVFIVVGLSLGFGLIITLFGAPLLVLTVVASWLISSFERELANRLLNKTMAQKGCCPSATLGGQSGWAEPVDRGTWGCPRPSVIRRVDLRSGGASRS